MSEFNNLWNRLGDQVLDEMAKGSFFDPKAKKDSTIQFIQALSAQLGRPVVGAEQHWYQDHNLLNRLNDNILPPLIAQGNKKMDPISVAVVLVTGITVGVCYAKYADNKKQAPEPPEHLPHVLLLIVPANKLPPLPDNTRPVNRATVDALISHAVRFYGYPEGDPHGEAVAAKVKCDDTAINREKEQRVFVRLSVNAKPGLGGQRNYAGLKASIAPNAGGKLTTLKNLASARSTEDFHPL